MFKHVLKKKKKQSPSHSSYPILSGQQQLPPKLQAQRSVGGQFTSRQHQIAYCTSLFTRSTIYERVVFCALRQGHAQNREQHALQQSCPKCSSSIPWLRGSTFLSLMLIPSFCLFSIKQNILHFLVISYTEMYPMVSRGIASYI